MSNILNVVVKDVEPEAIPGDDSANEATTPDTGRFTTSVSQSPANPYQASYLPAVSLGGALLCLVIYIVFKTHHGQTLAKNKIVRKITLSGFLLFLAFGIIGSVTNFSNTNAAEASPVTTSDITITVEREKGASGYAIAKAEFTINQPTAVGYALSVYAPTSNILKSEDATIEPVSATSSPLAPNTYGVTSADAGADATAESEIWNPITKSADEPLIIASQDTATAAGDKATFYYGVYVDKDLPAGTYSTELEYQITLYNRDSVEDLHWLQDFATLSSAEYTGILNSMEVNQEYTLKDKRDEKPYKFAKMSSGRLYMLENLKLDATDENGEARKLNSEDSDITTGEFTIPTETWEEENSYFCKATMAVGDNGEYYYNWYAAKANPNQNCPDPNNPADATEQNDDKSLGSICPAGWTLPTYTELTPEILWDNGNNPARLGSTQGYVGGYGVVPAAGEGAWHSANRYDDTYEFALALRTTDYIHRGNVPKLYGFSVRCMNGSSTKHKITFDTNGGTFDDSSTTLIEEIPAGAMIGDLPENVSRQDYFFKGWFIAPTGGDKVYSNSFVPTESMTLYAHWGMTINLLTYMQDFYSIGSENASDVVYSMETFRQYQLMDNRDNKTYFIAKLPRFRDDSSFNSFDVWMTQNLDHDIVTTPNFYTFENTDLLKNIHPTWTSELATYATGDTTWFAHYEVDGYYDGEYPESYDPGDLCWDGTLVTDGSASTLENHTVPCDQNGSHYHVGNYYNWTAAVAANKWKSAVGADYTAYQSICPAGWELPRDRTVVDGIFTDLTQALGLTTGPDGNVQDAPVYFIYGGNWRGQSRNFGSSGVYPTNSRSSGNVGQTMVMSYAFTLPVVAFHTAAVSTTKSASRSAA